MNDLRRNLVKYNVFRFSRNLCIDTKILLNCFTGVPARPKVFCLGQNKTGTSTFGKAMQILGHKHVSWSKRLMRFGLQGNYMVIRWVSKRFSSFDDKPWNNLDIIPRLMEWYPDAYFILLTRDPEKWYHSDLRFRKSWHSKAPSKDIMIREYLAREESIRKLSIKHRVKFTEISWEDGHGWHEL